MKVKRQLILQKQDALEKPDKDNCLKTITVMLGGKRQF